MCEVEYAYIERFPGYRFGDDGTVWSRLQRYGRGKIRVGDRWKQMKPGRTTTGYFHITLRDVDGNRHKCIPVHRLILEAFRGPCPPGMEARHFPDATRTNNRLENLAWGTRSENFLDKWPQGTMPHGESHGMSKLTVQNVRDIRRLVSEGVTQTAVANKFGVRQGTISYIVLGQVWKWLPQEEVINEGSV